MLKRLIEKWKKHRSMRWTDAPYPVPIIGNATEVIREGGDMEAPDRGTLVCFDGESIRQHRPINHHIGKGKTNFVIRPLFKKVMADAWLVRNDDLCVFNEHGDPERYLESFPVMGAQTRELVLRKSLEAMASGTVDYEGAASLISRLFAIHLVEVEKQRVATEERASDNADRSDVRTAVIRMLERDKEILMEERQMFTDGEWAARAAAIESGEIDMDAMRAAEIVVPFYGDEDLKGLPEEVLDEMVAEYRRFAVLVGECNQTYEYENLDVTVGKDGVSVVAKRSSAPANAVLH
ncbi:hypothetical protein [Agrobacterium radiobacter]|uniref:hypothetical protein n=1 Tax=Agrobacterium radiobacter TaxID=362 RepID=UPI003CE51223